MTLGEFTVRSEIEIARGVTVYAFVTASSRGDRKTSASFSDGVIQSRACRGRQVPPGWRPLPVHYHPGNQL